MIEADRPTAAREAKAAAPLLPLWRKHVVTFMTHAFRNRIARYPAIVPTSPIASGGRLNVPGNPLAIHTPGHTPGSVSFAFDHHDAVFVGDAMVNLDPVTYRPGVSVGPRAITADRAMAVDSLAHLEQLPHSVVLFGHGKAIDIGIGASIQLARSAFEDGR